MSRLVLVVLCVPATAWAVDLDTLVEAWTRTTDGQGGSDGVDEALGAVIDSAGHVVVVGYVDGAPNHGSDGYVVAYDPPGNIAWNMTQDVGEIGVDHPSSEDRLYAVGIDPFVDDLAFCGSRGSLDSDDPSTLYLVEAWSSAGFPGVIPTFRWDQVYRDGALSPDQECRGVTWQADRVLAAGWAMHSTDVGRWVTWDFDAITGFTTAPITYEFSEFAAVPDQAYDVAMNTITGEYAVVGTRGVAGLEGSVLNDTDWHVRYYDPTGLLLWEDTIAGAPLLEDKALAVVFDVSTSDLVVAGSTNLGQDNGPNADHDWLIVRYDRDGDGLGGPDEVWRHTFESAEGADERATSLVMDDTSEVLVGGHQVDPITGVDVWRVAKLAMYDGLELDEWVGPARAGNSRVAALDYRSGKVAIAGSIDDGTGTDFAVTVIEGDLDDDGVADSVDACPDDPFKAADAGVCGCNVPDFDGDLDGFENCIEECTNDPEKQEPGICGCDQPDTDTDGDGTFDCNDDCVTDPAKIAPGECGCNAPDSDTDGDGVIGCHDACNNTPPGLDVDEFGCPPEEDDETGDTGDGPGGGGDKDGCGCATGPLPAVGGILPLLALVALRRRQRVAD